MQHVRTHEDLQPLGLVVCRHQLVVAVVLEIRQAHKLAKGVDSGDGVAPGSDPR